MLKQSYTIEDVSKRDIDILKKSGIKFNIIVNPYDHTCKDAEFDSEDTRDSALELLMNNK